MRKLILLFCMTATYAATAQTSVIRLKSTHGDLSEIPKSVDKFGDPPINSQMYQTLEDYKPLTVYDTFELITNTCVLQKGWQMMKENRVQDTICDSKFESEQQKMKNLIRLQYGDKVIFIGFEKDESSIQLKNNPYFRKRPTKSSVSWIFILMVISGLGIYILQPKLSWKK